METPEEEGTGVLSTYGNGDYTTVTAVAVLLLITIPQVLIYIGFVCTEPDTNEELVGSLTAHRWASVLFGVTIATNLVFAITWIFAIRTSYMLKKLQGFWNDAKGPNDTLRDILLFREALYITLSSAAMGIFYFIWCIYGIVIFSRILTDLEYTKSTNDEWLLADLIHTAFILLIYLALLGYYGRKMKEPYQSVQTLFKKSRRIL
jgi:hypothetical protein